MKWFNKNIALTIFLGSFLLFQVQPLIGKYILPWFGGGPAVWTTCMLFFQVALLGGYAYSHFITSRFSPRKQVMVHVAILLLAVLILPITPSVAWKPGSGDDPVWRILALLTVTVGLPYFILSTTSPLLQAWFARVNLGRSPYNLYALSNVGSLIALLSYPFVVEPAISLNMQTTIWSAGFVLFAALCAYCALRIWSVKGDIQGSVKKGVERLKADVTGRVAQRPELGVRLLWLALPAAGSIMLLAVTNVMCWDVSVVPFLWVLPLTLYLLSFIITFHDEKWYMRNLFRVLLLLSIAGMLLLFFVGVRYPIILQIAGYSIGLFVCCMVCHGEMVRLKPNPKFLTSFYLSMSAGGALGGIFVAVVAPYVFKGFLELHIGMMLVCILALASFWRDKDSRPAFDRSFWMQMSIALVFVLLVSVVSNLAFNLLELSASEHVSRNFYGVLRVLALNSDDPELFKYNLMHGRIVHGTQFVSEELRRQPVSYFTENSGLGLTLLNLPQKAGTRKVGIVGLGVGTIAAYGRPGDKYIFYEIDPDVERVARRWFTYLNDSQAECDVVLGDGRLSLERAEPQHFDVLVLDAFSGDAIPTHLLTLEAFEIYLQHMKPDGVIAVQMSNRFIDLRPVVRGVGEHLNLSVVVIKSKEPTYTTWGIVTRNRDFLEIDAIQSAKTPEMVGYPNILWTDDYSNLFQILIY